MSYESLILPDVDWQDVIERPTIRVSPDTLVTEAIAIMNARQSNYVAFGKQGQLQGIFTTRDAIGLIATEQVTKVALSEVMNRQPVTISSESEFDPIELAALLEKSSTHHLLVIDRDKTIGVITCQSLANALFPNQIDLGKENLALPIAETTQQLVTAKIDLEYLVQHRTSELKIANRLLQQQIKRYFPKDPATDLENKATQSIRIQLIKKATQLLDRLDRLEPPWWMGGAIALGLIFGIELLRYWGIVVPVPVVPIIAVAILSASLDGMKAGLLSVLVCSLYLTYTTAISDSPLMQIGNTLHLALSIAIVGIVAIIRGRIKQKYYKLTSVLQSLNFDLEREVKRRTEQLSNINTVLKQEVRDRSIVETQLKDSEAKYRAIFEQAAVGIVRAGTDKRLLRVNPKYCQMLGYSAEELQQLTFEDITYPEDRPSDDIDLKRLLSGEISTLVKEKRYLHRNGSFFWVKMTVALVYDAERQPGYFIAVIEDINERKKAELALQESEARFFSMVNSFPFPVWVSDENGSCNFFNQAWLDFTGKSLEQELNNGWAKGIHSDELQSCINIYQSAFDKRQAFSMEYRLRRFDSKYRWILDSGQPRFKPDGSFAGFVGAAIDIDDRITAKIEREQLLERIEHKKQFLEAVLQQMPAGVVIASAPDGKIILSNQQLEPILRHPLVATDKIEDYARYGCLSAEGQRRKSEEYPIVKALNGKVIIGEETQYLCGDGIVRTLFVNAAPIFNSESRIIAAVATFYDITELKQAQKIKKDAENKALMLKEINHRIKNNLQIISALLDLQSEQVKEPKVLELFVESQARIQTIALIHEKLYSSKNFERIELSDYVRALASYLQKSFVPHNKQIEIIHDVAPIDIDIDNAICCGLIINELVTNALQHGFKSQTAGIIKIYLRQLTPSLISLTVWDNGVGIAEVDLENIQSLGLSLVDSLVRTQLEGKLSIQRSNGTIFKIEFAID